MRKFPRIIRTSLSFVLLLSLTISAKGQSNDLYNNVHPYVDVKETGSEVDCKKREVQSDGNYINNNGFKTDHSVNETNPFAQIW